jgi:hypothetical protein
MYAWRYLLLAIPSAGLLGPAALAWTLRRFDWKRAGLSVLLALPLWLLAAFYCYGRDIGRGWGHGDTANL